jgi:hypothetical protein
MATFIFSRKHRSILLHGESLYESQAPAIRPCAYFDRSHRGRPVRCRWATRPRNALPMVPLYRLQNDMGGNMFCQFGQNLISMACRLRAMQLPV